MAKEVWKDIPGWEGYYQVSNKGRVKSLVRKWCKKERVMKLQKDERGYPFICLTDSTNNRTKKYRVHQVVALAFVENIDKKPEINHIDGVKTNNMPDNLEWVTQSENAKHACKIGLWKMKGEDHPGGTKLKEKDVLYIRELILKGIKQNLIAKMYNITTTYVCDIKYRRAWSHI